MKKIRALIAIPAVLCMVLLALAYNDGPFQKIKVEDGGKKGIFSYLGGNPAMSLSGHFHSGTKPSGAVYSVIHDDNTNDGTPVLKKQSDENSALQSDELANINHGQNTDTEPGSNKYVGGMPGSVRGAVTAGQREGGVASSPGFLALGQAGTGGGAAPSPAGIPPVPVLLPLAQAVPGLSNPEPIVFSAAPPGDSPGAGGGGKWDPKEPSDYPGGSDAPASDPAGDATASPTPEPGSLALLGIGVVGLIVRKFKKSQE